VVKPGKGYHINIKMPNGMIVTLRAVGKAKIGLLRQAIKKAGPTEADFVRYLR